MSVTVCPHCQHKLDPFEDSIYCEECGGNIMRPPPSQEKRILFTPHIWVRVENGEIVSTDIDWNDSCAGVEGEGAAPHGEDQDQDVTTQFIDNSQLQERVLNALTAGL